MKLHRFFISENFENKLDNVQFNNIDVIHQIKKVLRLKPGDEIIILNNTGTEYLCEIVSIAKNNLSLNIKDIKKTSLDNKIKFVLYPSIIKKDKLEYVLQKCTEIGVFMFCPLVSDRTEKLNYNMKRAETIIKEAAEQSEKSYLPSIDNPIELSELVKLYETDKKLKGTNNVYYLDIDAPIIDVIHTRETILNSESDRAVFFVGPEGGWSETDINCFHKINAKPVSLGETTLRSETASISAAALMLLGHK